ncbi:hypothetical protein WA026_009844 [Henosepilachna vigintioctopunctata]|uniref:LAGLIDADG homing endonuclease n=1 Tax=Henosepilachna vigintioctopunctata TaxID=420089 RepID=A0AAW1TR44_9CUCU
MSPGGETGRIPGKTIKSLMRPLCAKSSKYEYTSKLEHGNVQFVNGTWMSYNANLGFRIRSDITIQKFYLSLSKINRELDRHVSSNEYKKSMLLCTTCEYLLIG